MAQRATLPAPPVRRFAMRDLWRVALWGITAGAAVSVAAVAATSDGGNHRLMAAAAHLRLVPQRALPVAPAPQPAESDETRQLADTVKSLAVDRDRLLARLNTLEKTLDVTASVPRTAEPQLTPIAPSTPPPAVAMPENIPVQTVMPRPSPQATAPQASAPQPQTAVTPEPV